MRDMPIVCRHIVRNVESCSSTFIGYHTAPSDKRDLPQAWCNACDKRMTRAGGWTPEVLEKAGFQELCPCCYLFAQPEGAH